MELTCPHCQERNQYSGKRPGFCAYCGKAIPVSVDDATVDLQTVVSAEVRFEEDPKEIGGYRLLKRLGEGGMGRVYEAEDIATGQRVAVKIISAKYANSPVALERFRREGRLASGVAHPRCVFIFAADEAKGRPYIVMELMPGATLQDSVDRAGPIAIETAVPLILDVIDGLRELHRLGIVHRDVKPSNCLIDAGGRVKVADFGLSRSLVEGSAVTQTGSFVGTPLFAAPEQIKGAQVTPRSDVYSAAATLYCLLTGRAPFQGNDPAATLARIASEPAPPMRSLRPDLPETLDEVVLRGLERDPAKRWANLDDFRQALEVFAPGQLSIGGLGVRFGAYMIDVTVLYFFVMPLGLLYNFAFNDASIWTQQPRADHQLFGLVMGSSVWWLYYGGSEWLWNCTLGKYLLGLRLSKAARNERPGRGALLLRTAVFFFCTHSYSIAVQSLMLFADFYRDVHDVNRINRESLIMLAVSIPVFLIGIGLLLCTMRARNGYRGLHEWLSGTRVVRLPVVSVKNVAWEYEPAMPIDAVRKGGPAASGGTPARIGPFDVVGMVAKTGPRSCVLLGFDASLGRHVWIWLRPGDGPPLSAARRNCTRVTRIRWLAGGREGAAQWDAFVAPDSGASVAGPMPRPLDWEATRHLLTQLADELNLAENEDTLPESLSPAQVWVWPDGRLCLLDAAVGPGADNEDVAPLQLLAQTAVWALGAKPQKVGKRIVMGLPLPCYAAAILERLLSQENPYDDVEEFQADLTAVADKPLRTSRLRRLAHVALLALFLNFGLCMGLMPAFMLPSISIMSLTNRVRMTGTIQERLAAVTACDAANALAANDPHARWSALVNAHEDARLHQRMSQQLVLVRKERDARMAATDPLNRNYANAMEKQIDESNKRMGVSAFFPGIANPDGVRRMARQENHEAVRNAMMPTLAGICIVMAAMWPVIWVLWAFAIRGGLSYYIVGLALVRRDGRPALRIQCAWRAFLVWAPLGAFAIASAGFDYLYWQSWIAGAEQPWFLSVSQSSSVACLVLLPLYVVLALSMPRRGPHDWLSGTYVVPR